MQIHGKVIYDFPFGDSVIEQHFCDFFLRDDSHEFIIEIADYPLEVVFDLLARNESIYKDYLFCQDENGRAFTIYNCYIKPMQIPVKQMKVIWCKCLWGYHIEKLQDEKIISAKYIVQTDGKKYPFHMFIGRNDFEVLEGKARIGTDWNQENFKFEGVAISVSLKEAESINEVEKIVLRLLELFSLQIGFFPKVERRTMVTENQKTFCLMEDFAAYGKTAKPNIKLDYVLYTKKDFHFSAVYDYWWNLREKEVVTFNLFSYLTTESSPVVEVPVATCIQCLEGYFRVHHSKELLKFSKSAKKKIRKEIFRALDSSEELKEACRRNEVEYENIRKSLEGLSGHINEYSLQEILRYAIERNNSAKRLFQYERETKTDDQVFVMDLFIQKAMGHRNWLSHLRDQPNRFVNEEVELADKKLRMLFRLTLLYDIGFKVTNTSLDAIIEKINRWYAVNTLI